MWCDGARETRESHVTIGRIVSKSERTKNIPAFQDLNGSLSGLFCNFGNRKSYKIRPPVQSNQDCQYERVANLDEKSFENLESIAI